MSTEVIIPTVGRRVWYWPNEGDRVGASYRAPMMQPDQSQPCDAGIAYVWNDRRVNLTVADHNGQMHSRCSVRLLQGNDTAYPGETHATWMPYQKANAK